MADLPFECIMERILLIRLLTFWPAGTTKSHISSGWRIRRRESTRNCQVNLESPSNGDASLPGPRRPRCPTSQHDADPRPNARQRQVGQRRGTVVGDTRMITSSLVACLKSSQRCPGGSTQSSQLKPRLAQSAAICWLSTTSQFPHYDSRERMDLASLHDAAKVLQHL